MCIEPTDIAAQYIYPVICKVCRMLMLSWTGKEGNDMSRIMKYAHRSHPATGR